MKSGSRRTERETRPAEAGWCRVSRPSLMLRTRNTDLQTPFPTTYRTASPRTPTGFVGGRRPRLPLVYVLLYTDMAISQIVYRQQFPSVSTGSFNGDLTAYISLSGIEKAPPGGGAYLYTYKSICYYGSCTISSTKAVKISTRRAILSSSLRSAAFGILTPKSESRKKELTVKCNKCPGSLVSVTLFPSR